MKSDLIRAAEALEYEAWLLAVVHCEYGEWPKDENAQAFKSRHDDYLALANRLRKAK